MSILEHDRRVATLGALLLGAALLLPAGSAVAADATQGGATHASARQHFSLAKAGETFTRKGEIREIKLTAIDSGGRFTIVDGYLSVGMKVPAHFHAWHSETFYVLEGQEEWTVNGETHLLTPGALVYIPPGAVHSARVIGDKDSHHLLISEPGGHEYSIRRQQQQTPAEMANPEKQKELMELNDFHMPAPKQ
jgi:quercetin dioxygenase-like cupin family protein